MDIHNHPALQPVLRKSNIDTLVRYLDANKPEPQGKGGYSLDYLDGWRDAHVSAIKAIRMMWESSKIAAHAHALDLADQLEAEAADDEKADGYPVDGDALTIYQQTAGDLLALAVRLDLADQRDIDARMAALDSVHSDDGGISYEPDELDEDL